MVICELGTLVSIRNSFTWIVKSQLYYPHQRRKNEEARVNVKHPADGRTRASTPTSAQTLKGTPCQTQGHKPAAAKERETVLPHQRGTLVAAAAVKAAPRRRVAMELLS